MQSNASTEVRTHEFARVPGGRRIAVCICTYQREALLRRLLNHLANIELDGLRGELVLLVVDNAPGGRVQDICRGATEAIPTSMRYVAAHSPGLSSARNRAIEAALAEHADLIAFIDDDDLPERDWLVQLIRKHEETGADIVFGAHEAGSEVPDWVPFASRQGFKITKHYGVLMPSPIATANVLISARILLPDGPMGLRFLQEFNQYGGEDFDFFIRAIRCGASWAIAPGSVVKRFFEEDRLTYTGVFLRGLQAGGSRVFMARRHGRFLDAFAFMLLQWIKVLALVLPTNVIQMARTRKARISAVLKVGRWLASMSGLAGRRFRFYADRKPQIV